MGGTGEPPRRARPARHGAVPFRVLADARRQRDRVRGLRHAVRRPHPPVARRLSRHRHAGLRRDRAGRRSQLGRPHQRRAGAGRHSYAEIFRLRLRLLALPVLLPRPRSRRGRGVDLHSPSRIAAGSRLDGDPRGRAGGGRHGRQPRALQADGVRHGRGGRRPRRHLLRRQAHHGHPGHVHVPGLGDGAGHGGAGRAGLDPRRGDGRAVRGLPPVGDPAGPHRVRARPRSPRGQRDAAAGGADHLARADLRPDPRAHDDLPARGAVARGAARLGAHA